MTLNDLPVDPKTVEISGQCNQQLATPVAAPFCAPHLKYLYLRHFFRRLIMD